MGGLGTRWGVDKGLQAWHEAARLGHWIWLLRRLCACPIARQAAAPSLFPENPRQRFEH